MAGARGRVEPEHWPAPVIEAAPGGRHGLHAETRALEERRLREALDRAHGNKSRAARSLGLSRQGLLKKLKRYGLEWQSLDPEEDLEDVLADDPAPSPAPDREESLAGSAGLG